MSSGREDEVIPIPYANERDRRIYEPGYFHSPHYSVLDHEERREQREKFYRMEASK
jgi:hypothetical protein